MTNRPYGLQCRLNVQNPGCSWNGTDLQDPIRNGDVAQVRQRNEFGKKQWREKIHDEIQRNPCCSPILAVVNHISPLIGLNFLQLRAAKFKHAQLKHKIHDNRSNGQFFAPSNYVLFEKPSDMLNQWELRNSILFANSLT